jgi:hypothetical protein
VSEIDSLTSTLNGIISVVKMSPRLKDRNKSVPNGFSMYVPELKWSAPKNFPSFTVVSNALQAVVEANPVLAAKHQWPRDRAGIENWVDAYNATVCARMGWTDYIIADGGGGSLPKSVPPPQNLASLSAAVAAARKLVAGAKTLIEWLDSGDPPVDRDEATRRAAICSACPHNSPDSIGRWFTVPASELIRRQVQKLAERSISTIHDEKLNLCDICLCPLRLKVQTPRKWITSHLSPEVLEKLRQVPGCWVADAGSENQST